MRSPKYMRTMSADEQVLCNQRIAEAYADLHRWIRWLASTLQINGHWYMSADDMAAEGYWVLCKVARVYLHKPYPEFKVLCKTSIHNAIKTMRYRTSVTHRKTEMTALSLDAPIEDGTCLADFVLSADGMSDAAYECGMNPEHYVLWAESYLDLVDSLSDFDITVLDACLGFDDRVLVQVKLSAARKSFVYANTSVTITPLIVARALNQPLEAVEESFERLRGLF